VRPSKQPPSGSLRTVKAPHHGAAAQKKAVPSKRGGAEAYAIASKTKRAKKSRGSRHIQALKGGSAWISYFFGAEGLVSIERVAQQFGMSKGQLAETIGVRREAVYRQARAKTAKTQSRTTEMLEIVGRIAGWAGGEKQAMAWYRAEPIPAFGGRTAESLVKEGKAAAVRDYLDHVATGGFA
jgi:hypothetical protein